MWWIIVIAVVGYLIYSVTKDKNRDNKENVASYGGMQIKYKQLIDYLTEGDYSKLKGISKDNITIQTDSFNATIDYFGGKTEVQMAIKHPVYGYSTKKWKYDDGYPQERIISDIDFHLSAILKNQSSNKVDLNQPEFSNLFIDVHQREASLKRTAKNMGCSIDEVQKRFTKDFFEKGFFDAGIEEFQEILELKMKEEAKLFNIKPQNTIASMMLNWGKILFLEKSNNSAEINSIFKRELNDGSASLGATARAISDLFISNIEKLHFKNEILLKIILEERAEVYRKLGEDLLPPKIISEIIAFSEGNVPFVIFSDFYATNNCKRYNNVDTIKNNLDLIIEVILDNYNQKATDNLKFEDKTNLKIKVQLLIDNWADLQ